MSVPGDLKFTKSHEWAKIEDGVCTVGITDFAVEELNKEIVNVELPEVGDEFEKEETFGVLDAVKAAFDLCMPIAGKIKEVNEALLDDPTIVANGPYTGGWMIRIEVSNASDADDLMDADAYGKLIESENTE